MLITPEHGFYRATITLQYATVEFTGRTRTEAMGKAYEWKEKYNAE